MLIHPRRILRHDTPPLEKSHLTTHSQLATTTSILRRLQRTRKLTSKAVFPDAVGPVITVNLFSGKTTDIRRSLNPRSSASLSSSSVDEPEESATAVSPEMLVVVESSAFLEESWPCFVPSDTWFHLRVASSKPRPSSSTLVLGPKFVFFREHTCSVTSSSSR